MQTAFGSDWKDSLSLGISRLSLQKRDFQGVDFVGSYLVVGGSSDIGLILCERLIEDGDSVTVIGRDSSRMSQIKELGAKVFIGDATDELFVSEVVTSFSGEGDGKLTVSLTWLVHC